VLDSVAQSEEPLVTAGYILLHRERRKSRIKYRHHRRFHVRPRKNLDWHPRERHHAENRDQQRRDNYQMRIAQRKLRHR